MLNAGNELWRGGILTMAASGAELRLAVKTVANG